MQHHFDVDIAVRYGMVEAILINHYEYWIELNRTNDRNYYDGRYWTFNSMKAMLEIFPYLTEKKIRTALKNLQDEGLILTGNYNRSAYDRTLWYAFSDLALSILPKRQMEAPEKANGFSEKGAPIPDNNTPDNTPKKPNENYGRKRPKCAFVPPTVEEVQAYCYEISASIDPSAFVDYYAAQGWVYGKAGKQMKDWRAAVRNWNRREKQNGGNNGNRTGIDQRSNGNDCLQNQPTKRLKNAFDYLDEIRAGANDSRPVEQTTGDIDWDELFGVP